jgi:hypothetical protein
MWLVSMQQLGRRKERSYPPQKAGCYLALQNYPHVMHVRVRVVAFRQANLVANKSHLLNAIGRGASELVKSKANKKCHYAADSRPLAASKGDINDRLRKKYSKELPEGGTQSGSAFATFLTEPGAFLP